MGEPLENLWAVTSGLCVQHEDVRWMQNVVDASRQTEEAQIVARFGDELDSQLEAIIESGSEPGQLMAAYCQLLETEDKQFMNDLKLALREGVLVFEELERGTISQGSQRLLDAVRSIPGVLEAYYARLSSGIQALKNRGR